MKRGSGGDAPTKPKFKHPIISETMLAGRESLVRLVGKRKRTLSSQLSRLLKLQPNNPQEQDDGSAGGDPSSPINEAEESPPSSSNGDGNKAASEVAEKQQGTGTGTGNENADAIYGSEWVSCPVCGVSIRGTDYIVNSHLDTCLTRGTKRKLTQRTLLQLNFCPTMESKASLGVLHNPSTHVRKSELVGEEELYNSDMDIKISPLKDSEKSQHGSDALDKDLSNVPKCGDALTESIVVGDTVSYNMLPLNKKLPEVNVFGVGDANVIEVIETFIVGRKFHCNVEMQQGAGLTLSRDPQNAKDKHAIKVLSVDSGSGYMLGYLPRELAKFLSPLIDNKHLQCKGSVVSLPEHPLDAVPIQLVCQKVASDQGGYNDEHNFEFFWENVKHVSEYAKTNPPSTTKYQQNFCIMIENVVNNHAHLLMSNEKLLLGSFESLGDDAQRLFVRIYTRKGPWFRISNISYPEISDVQRASEELQSAGYICSFNSSEDIIKYNMKEVLALLTVSELREVFNLELRKKATNCTRRQDLINFLILADEDGTCQLLPERVLERVGMCIKISSAVDTLLWRVQRLFFLNGEQDLSSFLLSDLGLIKFPEYTCTITHPIFGCRSDLLEYEEAVEVAQIMDEALDENNVERVIQCIDVSQKGLQTGSRVTNQISGCDTSPAFFSRFSASWVYSKVLSLGVSVFERERRYEDAIRLLRELLSQITHDSRRGNWTLRLSVDLEHIGRISESLSIAEEGVLDPWVRAGAKMALQRRVLRLGKPPRRWKTPSYANSVRRIIKEVSIRGRPLTSETGSKNLFYGYDGELCGVEELALQYYSEEGGGWQGLHSESGIWMTIFGILMWDVIFANIPDVFRSRFQMGPLDLLTDDFYVSRKDIIESCLDKIQEGMAEEMLIASWESHVGTACHGVNWDRQSLSDLRAVVSCIGGRCLASLCRHLALDYRSWSSGMPDLLLWRFHGGDMDGGEAKLVEVKGPRDRLSEQQRAWMLILMDCGFDVEVCKVSPTAKP